MAINIRCKNCKTELKLSEKKCHNCDTGLPAKGWIYKITLRAGGRKVTRTARNLELAREIEAKLRTEISRGEHDLKRKKPAPTLDQVWKKFLPWAQEHKKSWRTDDYYYRKHIDPVFGKEPLDKISAFDVEKLMLTMKKGKNQHGKPFAAATIKHQVVLLSRLYSIAGKWGLYYGPNPCQQVKKPKLNNKKTEFLTDEELFRLLAVLEKWPEKMTVAFIRFALMTGLRRSEMFKLTWNDVDMDRQYIILRDPKGILDQTLPISTDAIHVLRNVPREYETTYVFYGKNGQRRTDFKGPWNRIKKAAKLPADFRLHGLRHNWASTLASNGTDLYTISKLLGHKDISTTQRYAHLADLTLRDAVDLSEKLLNPKKSIPMVRKNNE